MNTFTDTLTFSKELLEAKFSADQADILAQAFKTQEQTLVTNTQLETTLKTELEKLELRLKLYNGATAVAVVSVLATLKILG